MLVFRILLVLLVAAPTIVIAAVLFCKARGFSRKLNKEDTIRELAGNTGRYRGFIDE